MGPAEGILICHIQDRVEYYLAPAQCSLQGKAPDVLGVQQSGSTREAHDEHIRGHSKEEFVRQELFFYPGWQLDSAQLYLPNPALFHFMNKEGFANSGEQVNGTTLR